MKVIYSNGSLAQIDGPTGVGLGNFDGLHIGHMSLINTLINESKINRYQSILYTFTKHPENILRKKLLTPLLTSVNKKISLLNETPLNYLYFEEFDECYSRMSPESFVKDVIVDKLKAKLVVVGFDYRFGYNGQGDTEALTELGEKYNLKVIVIPPIRIGNSVVSSTLIREAVADGYMEKVFELLGRHYSITGTVQTGRMIGRSIGFPTANIHPEQNLILPCHGVYVTRTFLDGEFYPSITNVGDNPTVSQAGNIKIETHLINFYNNIYNKNIEVFFLSKLRNQIKFNDRDELKNQIAKDVSAVKEHFDI